MIDPQMEAEEKGLQATKEDTFNQITQGANRRGLVFSGIPLQEQAQYTGQSYLPAVANMKAKFAQQKFNLQDALAKIIQEQRKDAYNIYGQEVAQDEAARARSAGGGGGGFNFGSGASQVQGASTGGYGYQKKKDGGFAFVDPNGNPISAATYAKATKTPFRQLLETMARQGDASARQALGFVGNDYRYDAGKINNTAPNINTNRSIYNALTWGAPITNPILSSGVTPSEGKYERTEYDPKSGKYYISPKLGAARFF